MKILALTPQVDLTLGTLMGILAFNDDTMMVSFGYRTTHIVPFSGGTWIPSACRRLSVGGAHVSWYLHQLLSLKYPCHSEKLTLTIAEVGFVAKKLMPRRLGMQSDKFLFVTRLSSKNLVKCVRTIAKRCNVGKMKPTGKKILKCGVFLILMLVDRLYGCLMHGCFKIDIIMLFSRIGNSAQSTRVG